MRALKFENEQYFHTYNRGVDKRIVFNDKSDYVRFINYLFLCNDAENAAPAQIRKILKNQESDLVKEGRGERQLVDILCFSLMPNHFHFLLKQLVDNGISIFMHRVSTAYTMFFNKRNERSGSLFQGTFKAKLMDSEEYLLYLTKYIHLNHLDIIEPNWKKDGIKDKPGAMNFLRNYPWSSYGDYVGYEKFNYLISKEDVKNYDMNNTEYSKFVEDLLHLNFEKLTSRLSLD